MLVVVVVVFCQRRPTRLTLLLLLHLCLYLTAIHTVNSSNVG